MLYIGSDAISNAASASIAIPLPVGRDADDLCFLHVTASQFPAVTINTPAGWTAAGSLSTGGLGAITTALFYKRLSGAEGASVTVTTSGSCELAGTSSVHRGIGVGAFIDVAVATGTVSLAQSVTATYAATAAEGSRVLAFVTGTFASVESESTTDSFYGGESVFRSAYTDTSFSSAARSSVYLDQTLPGEGEIEFIGDGALRYWAWWTVAVLSADPDHSPEVDSLRGLTTQAPPRSVGVVVAAADEWDLILSVQVATPVPDDGYLWDSTFIWDTTSWASGGGGPSQWHDISGLVRGLEWSRGAQSAGDRPEVGEARVTVDNLDGDVSAWAATGEFTVAGASWLRPRMLIRFGVTASHDGIFEYLPFFTGRVESLPDETSGNVDGWVTFVCVETLETLAQTNEVALVSPVGSGDTLEERIDRLIDAAGWPFGVHHLYDLGLATLQSTDMSANRLTDIYLAADSAYARAVAGSDGALWVTNQHPTSPTAALEFSNDPAGAELPVLGVQPYASTDRMLNRAVGARVGGTQLQEDDTDAQSQDGILARGYGFPRSDLIMQTDESLEALLTQVVLDHAADRFGVERIQLDADMNPVTLYRVLAQYAALGIERRQPLVLRWVHPGGNELLLDLRVDGYTMGIVPLGPGVPMKWTAAISTSKDA